MAAIDRNFGGSLLGPIWAQLQNPSNPFFAADANRTLSRQDFCRLALRYAAGIRVEDRFGRHAVPVLVGRRIEAMAAIVGALLAGRAFAPLSASQPASRIAQCLEALGASAAVNGLGADEALIAPPCPLIGPADQPLPVEAVSAAPANGGELLYILFTSGSTGVPKGVICSHANILNTLLWSLDFINWAPDDRIGVATQFSFDISMFDLFSGLFFGIPICIFEQPGNIQACLTQIEAHRITSIFSVPFFFSQFVRGDMLESCERSSLRRILSGGDFFPPPHMLAWREAAPSVAVLNVWGPTETSIVNTMHVVTAGDVDLLRAGQTVAVGESHPRMEIMLLDPEAESATPAAGEEGEIAMLGACVSLGYLNNPELTARQYFERDGVRGFRTGDIGRLDGGKLYIVGRTGSLVKVSGFRIDLNEVERALTQCGPVFQAVAFVHASVPGVDEIWSCIQPNGDAGEVDIFSLKRELRKKLPSYMVPKRILNMGSLPLSGNGKVDRKAVKAMVATAS